MSDRTSSPIQSWRYDARSGVATVALSADGSRVLVGTLGKTAVCLHGSSELLWQAQVGNQAWRAGLSWDGETAVIGSGSTRFWDMKGRNIRFDRCQATSIDLQDAHLRDLYISNSRIAHVQLEGTTIRNIYVSESILVGIDFTKTTFSSFYPDENSLMINVHLPTYEHTQHDE